jgi:hypothetical protein
MLLCSPVHAVVDEKMLRDNLKEEVSYFQFFKKILSKRLMWNKRSL